MSNKCQINVKYNDGLVSLKPFLKGCLTHYNKECEFRYNDKKNLHQVLLEMRKNLLKSW